MKRIKGYKKKERIKGSEDGCIKTITKRIKRDTIGPT